MVRGLKLFADYFIGHEDQYVLIGGAACDLAMENVGESFRATKDLDIVLCIETLKPDFVSRFWNFIKAGGYETKQKSTGKKLFYRFHSPSDKEYPYMLELFSRTPDALHYEGSGDVTPIPMNEEASSLSAILLDEEYYAFLHSGRIELEGVPMLRPEHVLPLKARAWLDLSARKTAGEKIDSKDVKKHRNDVFRLYRILVPANIPKLSGQVADDFLQFVEATLSGDEIQLKSFGYPGDVRSSTIVKEIQDAYGVMG